LDQSHPCVPGAYPRLCLFEQRLLDAALLGVTDEELATELKISLSAVKKDLALHVLPR
jgi:hypothetical protein